MPRDFVSVAEPEKISDLFLLLTARLIFKP